MNILKKILINYFFLFILFNIVNLIGLVLLMNTNPYFSNLDFEANGFAKNASIYNTFIFIIPILVTFIVILYFIIKIKIDRIIKSITFVIFFFSIARIDRIIKGWIYGFDYKVICIYIFLMIYILLFVLIFKNKKLGAFN